MLTCFQVCVTNGNRGLFTIGHAIWCFRHRYLGERRNLKVSTVRNKVLIGAMAQADYDQLDSAIQAYVDLDLDKASRASRGTRKLMPCLKRQNEALLVISSSMNPMKPMRSMYWWLLNTLNVSAIMRSILQSGSNMPLQAITKEWISPKGSSSAIIGCPHTLVRGHRSRQLVWL